MSLELEEHAKIAWFIFHYNKMVFGLVKFAGLPTHLTKRWAFRWKTWAYNMVGIFNKKSGILVGIN